MPVSAPTSFGAALTGPTSHDRSFIPYVLSADPEFEKCLPDTLVQEGGNSNDAHDPGGMTMMGIIQREYDLKRRRGNIVAPAGSSECGKGMG
jgi:hypothetical protein